MPLVCIQVSDEIISHARKVLTPQLSQSVYLTLTDHIDFALTRFREGMLFENGLYEEIKRFYPEEFQVGRHALDLIEEKTGVRLPEDEAASIAFHLVNAEFGIKMKDTPDDDGDDPKVDGDGQLRPARFRRILCIRIGW